MATAVSLGSAVGVKPACCALNIPRATFYRRKRASQDKPTYTARPLPPLALSVKERGAILDAAHEERFWDSSPYQIYATLLDEGTYLGSI
jgi:putative transposase